MEQTAKEEALQEQLIQIGQLCRQLSERNYQLERINSELFKELSQIKLSKSWRYTQRIRDVYFVLRINQLFLELKKLLNTKRLGERYRKCFNKLH